MDKETLVQFVLGGRNQHSRKILGGMSRECLGRFLLSRHRGVLRWCGKGLATEWLICVRQGIDHGVPFFTAVQTSTKKANATARRERRRSAKVGIPFEDLSDGATVSNDPARDDRIKRRRRRVIVEGRRKKRDPSKTRALLGMMSDGHLAAINAEEYVSFFAGAESAEIAQVDSTIEIENLLMRFGEDGAKFIMAILEDEAKTWRQAAQVTGIKQSRAREIVGEIGFAFNVNIPAMIDAVSKGA